MPYHNGSDAGRLAAQNDRQIIEGTVMKTKGAIAIALMLGLATAAASQASEIYKWTDADGNIHYGDRPSGEATEERLAIRSRPTDPSRVQAEARTVADARESFAEREAAKAEAQVAANELQVQREERKVKCSMYKERLTRFVQSRHLYREDANGERVYLDEAEMQAAREKVQEQVEEYCD